MCRVIGKPGATREDEEEATKGTTVDNTHNSCRKWNFQECPESCWNVVCWSTPKVKREKREWLGQRIIIYKIGRRFFFFFSFFCVFLLHSPNDSRRVLLLAYRLYMQHFSIHIFFFYFFILSNECMFFLHSMAMPPSSSLSNCHPLRDGRPFACTCTRLLRPRESFSFRFSLSISDVTKDFPHRQSFSLLYYCTRPKGEPNARTKDETRTDMRNFGSTQMYSMDEKGR